MNENYEEKIKNIEEYPNYKDNKLSEEKRREEKRKEEKWQRKEIKCYILFLNKKIKLN